MVEMKPEKVGNFIRRTMDERIDNLIDQKLKI
jgi:hypothetical protein